MRDKVQLILFVLTNYKQGGSSNLITFKPTFYNICKFLGSRAAIRESRVVMFFASDRHRW